MSTDRCYSISELNQLLNLTLEQQVGVISFEGELAEVKRAASGHVYARIQDQESQIDIVLWQSTAKTVSFPLSQGLAVRCRGKPNVYRKSGRLQIVVSKIELGGEGALRKKFLELKAKLEAEGLFSPERKRALPFLPRAIGVVTSQSGAAVHDIMVRLTERMPQVPVYLVDVRVQGPGSAEDIAAGLRFLDAQNLCDVIIVGRGGGSLEDLWAFNEEVVVRAIFAARTPVVSAVGHEVDVSLSDLVADVRAPTPTAAAEIVVPQRSELLRQIDELSRRIHDVERWFSPLLQAVDELNDRLSRRVGAVIEQHALHLKAAEAHLKSLRPTELLRLFAQRITLLQQRLSHTVSPDKFKELHARVSFAESRLTSLSVRAHERASHALEQLAQRFETVSPIQVLKRGYALVEKEGVLVRSTEQIRSSDLVSVRVSDGAFTAKVSDVDSGH